MWYRELRQRGTSGHSTINVLWKDDERPLYLTDNHRAAFWCWAQHVTPADSYGLIHVDWHWDGAGSSVDAPATLDSLRMADFETFDAALLAPQQGRPRIAVVRWDDYIDAFLRVCANMTDAHLAVHEDRGTTLAGKLEDAVDDGRARLHPPGFDLAGDGGRIPIDGLADFYRETFLRAAHVAREKLFRETDLETKICTHSCRANFVTYGLGEGRTETWIADRTGHRSSATINRYRHRARGVVEAGLGSLTPWMRRSPKLLPRSRQQARQQNPRRHRRNRLQPLGITHQKGL